MKCLSLLLPLLLIPAAVGHAYGDCVKPCDDPNDSCAVSRFDGSFTIELNLSVASPLVQVDFRRPFVTCKNSGTCNDEPRFSDCCANECDCKMLKHERLAHFKPKLFGDGTITCSSFFPEKLPHEYSSRISFYSHDAKTCKGEVCSTAAFGYGILCHAKGAQYPCKGLENGCTRRGNDVMCCCSNRDYCAGYVPTFDTFDANHSTARWPMNARPDTLRCHQAVGLNDSYWAKTSDATTCDGSACASIGYLQGGRLKSSFGCVARAECTRLFNDNFFVGCGVLYHQTGRGWLCCCSNGDYCNFGQYYSTAGHLFLQNATSPLSPLSPIADVVKSVLTPNPHEPVQFVDRGYRIVRMDPKTDAQLGPTENPTTTTEPPPTTTTQPITSPLPTPPPPTTATTAPPQPAADGALAAGAWGLAVAALLVVVAAV